MLISGLLRSQINNPINIPIKISGTFGELRNTHFHSGVDIKTEGKQGVKIFSIKDGYVKRIKISKDGFGKAIYLNHHDGTTSVYGHLKKFSSEIEKFVKEIQYKKKSYEIEIYPKNNLFVYKSGELIGYSGNTGSSSGPHLHFEVRDTKTNYPMNPLKILENVNDTIIPKINNLYLYDVMSDGTYHLIEKIKLKKINSNYFLTDTIKNSGILGIGINYYDKQDISYSKNGAYSIDFKMNNETIFEYKMDTISLYDKRYLKLLVDFENWYLKKNKIQKLFVHPKSKYTFLNKKNYDGIIKVENNKNYIGNIEIKDYNGNTSRIGIIIKGTPKQLMKKQIKNYNIKSDLEYTLESKNIKVKIKKNTFFNDVYIPFKFINDTLDLGKNLYPIDKRFKIIYDIKNLDSTYQKKGFISKINEKNKTEFIWTEKLNNIWSINTNILGKYTISIDTTPPSIKPMNFKNNQLINNQNTLKLRIKDDLSGIKKINGSINGKWILLEHEPKNNTISYNLSDINFNSSKYELEIVALDYLGNKKLYKAILYRN
tara:strand:+ start:2682 stop:4307 length:1626 start_codon:yes stop_codon:yes gene_type:complete